MGRTGRTFKVASIAVLLIAAFLLAMMTTSARPGLADGSSPPPIRKWLLDISWFHKKKNPACLAFAEVARNIFKAQPDIEPNFFIVLDHLPPKDFTVLAWQDADPLEHEAEIAQAFNDYYMPSLLHYVIEHDHVTDQALFSSAVWKRFSGEVMAIMTKTPHSFQTASIDLNGDGKVEDLFRVIQVKPPSPKYNGEPLIIREASQGSPRPMYSINVSKSASQRLYHELSGYASENGIIMSYRNKPYMWWPSSGGKVLGVGFFTPKFSIAEPCNMLLRL